MKTRDIVGRKLSRSNRMLVKEAYNRGVQFEVLKNKQFKMISDNKVYRVRRGRVSHSYNSRLAIRVTQYKEITSRYLKNMGFPTPENAVFTKNEIDRAWNWAKDILPVVLKPHNGTMGKLVFVNIDNFDEFIDCYKQIIQHKDSVLIERFLEGQEYRFTYVNREIVGIANRIPANIVGNGKNTIEELVKQKNIERTKRKNPIHKHLEIDDESKRVLSRYNYEPNSIPDDGEIVFLRENSNISTGGDAIDVTDEMNPEIVNEVTKAMKSISGLKVAGVDVIIDGDNFYILEINAHPMLTIHHYPWKGQERDVIGKVIDGMFPNTIQIKHASNKTDKTDRNKKSLLKSFFSKLK